MKTIVVSAVNIRKGGTLTILRRCLEYLSTLVAGGDWRVVALVHAKSLADYPGIEYIEMPWTIQSWRKRLHAEYREMKEISHRLAPVHLWLSLHDTTPDVDAERQAVYCQTSFPFMKPKLRDLLFDYKIVLFSMFTKYAYKTNIHRNKYLIVQAEWLRNGFATMFGIERSKFIVAPPKKEKIQSKETITADIHHGPVSFIFPASADCHKNFETLCRAAEKVEKEIGTGKFEVTLTIDGTENRYASWLSKHWGNVSSIRFHGYMDKETLDRYYRQSDCLIFPSRIETWGLPISEFAAYGKPMILADLPYAKEASSGTDMTAFFNPEDPDDLACIIKKYISKDFSSFTKSGTTIINQPVAYGWDELFRILLA